LIARSSAAIVNAMKSVDRPRLSERIDRFLRWFFTASPDDVVAPAPRVPTAPRSRTVARRKPTRPLPHHSGPVRVAVKAKQ
jgi:hypothetical protein